MSDLRRSSYSMLIDVRLFRRLRLIMLRWVYFYYFELEVSWGPKKREARCICYAAAFATLLIRHCL